MTGLSIDSRREARLRRHLAWYSPSWRAQHGEAMLGVLMDVAESAPGGELPLAQRLDLARNGLAERLVGWAPARLRSLAATSAFLGGTAFALFHFVFFEWEPWTSERDYFGLYARPFSTLSAWPELLWLAGALCFYLGWKRTATSFLAAAGAGAVFLVFFRYGHPSWLWPNTTTLAATIVPAVFVLAGDVRRRGTAVSPIAVATLAAAIGAVYRLQSPYARLIGVWRTDDSFLWFVPFAHHERLVVVLLPVAVAAAAVALLVAGRTRAASALAAAGLPWAAWWAIHGLHDGVFRTAGDLGAMGVTAERWLLAAVLGATFIIVAVLWRPIERKALAHG